MINCQPIQIIIYIKDTLREYYEKVKHREGSFQDAIDIGFDIKERCPLCGGKNCAKFLGFYYKRVVDERGTYYKAFPIARFQCKRKGGCPIVKHRTFSLLPYQLVPYTKYSIPFIIKTLKKINIEERSINEILEYWAVSNEHGTYFDLERARVHGFKRLIKETINKILTSGYYEEAQRRIQGSSEKQRIKGFIEYSEEFCCYKVEPCIRGPCGLSYDYYKNGGSYISNSYFLFGTPSQFRTLP